MPQKFVQGGVLVDPDNGGDGHNSHAEIAGLDEKVLRDEHILCRQLGQSLQFLLRLFQKSPWTSVDPQTQAGRGQYWKQDKERVQKGADCGIETAGHIQENAQIRQEIGGIRLGEHVGGDGGADSLFAPGEILPTDGSAACPPQWNCG